METLHILIPESITDSICEQSSPTKSIVNAVRLLKNSPITIDLQNGEQKVLPGCHALPDRSSHFLNIVSIEEIKGAIPHF